MTCKLELDLGQIGMTKNDIGGAQGIVHESLLLLGLGEGKDELEEDVVEHVCRSREVRLLLSRTEACRAGGRPEITEPFLEANPLDLFLD